MTTSYRLRFVALDVRVASVGVVASIRAPGDFIGRAEAIRGVFGRRAEREVSVQATVPGTTGCLRHLPD